MLQIICDILSDFFILFLHYYLLFILVLRDEIPRLQSPIRLPDVQVEDVHRGNSAVLQTRSQILVHTWNPPHIGDVEISTLSLLKFRSWSLILTLQSQNQLNYTHTNLSLIYLDCIDENFMNILLIINIKKKCATIIINCLICQITQKA